VADVEIFSPFNLLKDFLFADLYHWEIRGSR
jgi:hypothetical protein